MRCPIVRDTRRIMVVISRIDRLPLTIRRMVRTIREHYRAPRRTSTSFDMAITITRCHIPLRMVIVTKVLIADS